MWARSRLHSSGVCAIIPVNFAAGAGSGNRTRILSLEGCCTTIVLYPRTGSSNARGGGSRTRTCEGVRQRIYSPPPLPLGTFPQRVFSNKDHPRRVPKSEGVL